MSIYTYKGPASAWGGWLLIGGILCAWLKERGLLIWIALSLLTAAQWWYRRRNRQ